MKSGHLMNALLGIYIFIFFTYLFGPLLIMSVTAFNSAEFPSITPWECFSWRWFNEGKIAYDGQKLAGLATDWRLHDGFISSLLSLELNSFNSSTQQIKNNFLLYIDYASSISWSYYRYFYRCALG